MDDTFHQQLKNFVASPDRVKSQLEKSNVDISEKEELLKALKAEQVKVTSEMERLYQLYMANGMGVDGFGAKYKPLEERNKQLDDEIPRLQAEVDFLKIKLLSNDQVISEAKSLFDRWPHMEYDEKLRITETITTKIIIGKDEVTLHLAYLPSSENMANSEHTLRGSSRPRA